MSTVSITPKIADQIGPISSDTEFSSFVSNAEEALAIVNKLFADFSSVIIDKLKTDASDSNGFINLLSNIKPILSLIQAANSHSVQPVTTDLLNASRENDELIKKLFYESAYRIGSDVYESQSLLNDLSRIGLNINAAIRIPVLHQEYDKENKITNESVRMIGLSEMEMLRSNATEVESKKFSGALECEEKLAGGAYVISTLFVNCKNYEISKEEFDNSVFTLNRLISELASEFSKILNSITTAFNRIEQSKSVIESIWKDNLSGVQKIAKNKVEEIIFEIDRARTVIREIWRNKNTLTDRVDATRNIEPESIGNLEGSNIKIDPVISSEKSVLNERRVSQYGFTQKK